MKNLARAISAAVGSAAAAALAAALTLGAALPDRLAVTEGGELPIVSRGHLSVRINELEGGRGEADVRLLGCVAVKQVSVTVLEERAVVVSGAPIGIKMFTEGAVIVGMADVTGEDGLCCPARQAGLKPGDVIIEADGEKVEGNEQFSRAIEASGGRAVRIKYTRDGRTAVTALTPARQKDGSLRAGLWVRDSAAGIGTLTFYSPSGGFAGLGHAVCDVDTGQVMPLRSGEIVGVAVTGVVQGRAGTPGELTGTFLGTAALGRMEANNEAGIYGSMPEAPEGVAAQIAPRQEVRVGPATMLATVEGMRPSEYDVYIERVEVNDRSLTKNMVIRIDDPELLERTGGIVQGMSGCPVLQEGRLVGAVTHVFINDPTRGYGIFAENMLAQLESIRDE